MATILMQHQVKDFVAWKKVFDSNIELRTSNGEISAQIFRDASDVNNLTVLNEFNTMANAEKFSHSPELKAAMEKAGVLGKPTVYFLNKE